jgi:hypothetical protein
MVKTRSSRSGTKTATTARTANNTKRPLAEAPRDDADSESDYTEDRPEEEEPVKKKPRRSKPATLKKPPAARGGTTKSRAPRGGTTKSRAPSAIAKAKPQRTTTTTTKPPENMVHHLCQVGKPFLISTFTAMVGARNCEEDVLALCSAKTRNRTDALWDSLAGTPWQNDHDIALAALAASLSPSKLVALIVNDKQQREDYDTDDAADNFTSKACATIVDLFQRLWRLNVSRVKRHTIESCCRFLWEALADTPWCGRHCPRVAYSALRAYLDPAALADNAPVLATPGSATQLLQFCVTKQSAKVLYRLIPKKVQRVAEVSFIALKLGVITFRQMHPTVKTEKALQAGLRKNQFSWESLPPEMKQNIRYALALSPDTSELSPSFAEVWAAVVSDEKDRLWTELALQQPQRLLTRDWQLAPDRVKDDSDLMRSMVAHTVGFAAHISDRLAADFAFIDAILANNLQALKWLPQKTFECFPHIINSNSTLQALKMSGAFLNYTSARQLLIDKLSDRHHWSDRNFILRFAYHTLGVPDRFLKSNDVELYKVLVLSCRLKRKDNEFTYFEGSMDPNIQTCLELLRFGEYQNVRSCFTDRLFMDNNYKVWVAKQRYLVQYPHYGENSGEFTFRAKARSQLEAFQGCFTFMCGVKSRQEDGDDDCLL